MSGSGLSYPFNFVCDFCGVQGENTLSNNDYNMHDEEKYIHELQVDTRNIKDNLIIQERVGDFQITIKPINFDIVVRNYKSSFRLLKSKKCTDLFSFLVYNPSDSILHDAQLQLILQTSTGAHYHKNEKSGITKAVIGLLSYDSVMAVISGIIKANFKSLIKEKNLGSTFLCEVIGKRGKIACRFYISIMDDILFDKHNGDNSDDSELKTNTKLKKKFKKF